MRWHAMCRDSNHDVTSMIIHKLDICRPLIGPVEADAVSIVDSDAN